MGGSRGGEGGTSEPEVEAKSLSCGSNEKKVPSREKASKRRHCRPMYSTEEHNNEVMNWWCRSLSPEAGEVREKSGRALAGSSNASAQLPAIDQTSDLSERELHPQGGRVSC